MKIIYHCFGGSHSSVLAASLHLKLIDKERLPSKCELIALPFFDKTNNDDFGAIRLMGNDEFGNQVFVMGKKSMGNRYATMLGGVAEILGGRDQLLMVNCMNRVNWFMKLGGFTSRRIGAVSIGRPILEKGTVDAFFKLVNLVEITRLKAMAGAGL